MPRRGPLYAAWLAVHGVLAVWPITSPGHLDWPPFNAWAHYLNANIEGTPLNTYNVVLWGIVAALAIAQLARPADGRQRLWLAGWICMGVIAAVIAVEELVDLKARLSVSVASFGYLEPVSDSVRWIFLAAPFVLILGIAPAYVLYRSVRRHAELAALSGMSLIAGSAATAHEFVEGNEWVFLIEEGLEMVSAALLCVVLVELLARTRCAAIRVETRT